MSTGLGVALPLRAIDGADGFRAVLEARARELGPAPFLVLPEATLSFGEVDELANRFANVLSGRLGVSRGEVVAVRAGNGVPIVASWFACMKLGAVFMPVNPLLGGEPLRKVLAHCRAKVAVCEAALLAELDAVRDELPALRALVVAGAPSRPRGADEFDFQTLVDGASGSAPPAPPPDAGAWAKLMYTSGTTGEPKGVVWSRQCESTWGFAYGAELIPAPPGESIYTCLPLSHVTAQGTLLSALGRGARLVIDSRFEPFRFWERVRAADAVCFSFVGTILSVLSRLDRRPDDADNPVRWVLGAAAPTDRWRAIEERFGFTIVETYGQTELAGCWMGPASLPQRPGTVGGPLDGRFEARLVDPETGSDAAVGAQGELFVRPREPRLIFEGYLRADGGLDRAIGPDGWYRTGDLLTLDPDGAYRFTGRLREAIRRRGEMIAAGDIEEAAVAFPSVGEAAAIGVPADDGVEDEIKLCVVGHGGASVDIDELYLFLRSKLPRHMAPRYIEVWESFPKTPSTRVRKHLLAEAGVSGAWDARRRRRRSGP